MQVFFKEKLIILFSDLIDEYVFICGERLEFEGGLLFWSMI